MKRITKYNTPTYEYKLKQFNIFFQLFIKITLKRSQNLYMWTSNIGFTDFVAVVFIIQIFLTKNEIQALFIFQEIILIMEQCK